jgi:hypothetical protein
VQSLCENLSDLQQACLVMPYARTKRSKCAPLFEVLNAETRNRLDALFLAPP